VNPLTLTAWSLHLPGVDLAAHLDPPPGAWAREPAVPPERAGTVLGRKGLLYKEPATRLALCAVHRALGLAPGTRPTGPVEPGTAVVVAGNLGNVDTVARVTRTVAAEGGSAVSVLDAPNVSSNVVASTVALWFGFGGPSLMVCSGARAGLDALRLGGLLLRAGRARRVVLVGVEPDDEEATALFGAPLSAGAACVVLSAAQPEPGNVVLATEPVPPSARCVGPGGFDPARHWGNRYGATDVVTLALAAHLAADEGAGVVGIPEHSLTLTAVAGRSR
jgi:3-oxoacyl-[acyl-carrier-protein] synthase II